ncbi:MAG TPA: hypothetical protein VIY73_26340 [Polyangiaceae bacterium]
MVEEGATRTIARACNAAEVVIGDRDLPCFPVSPDDSSRNVTTSRASEPASASGPRDVEIALAAALARAAEAGRFDVVALLARELEAQRLARASNVVRNDDHGTESRR